ncbi:Cyclic nucleotide-gated ion channel 2 [Trifolium repens]|nr:Cyclic nucleotide-gated ion channel 2 [Trifolium repens]
MVVRLKLQLKLVLQMKPSLKSRFRFNLHYCLLKQCILVCLLEGVGVLGIQHVASCLQQQCERTVGCNLSLSYSKELCYQSIFPQGTIGNPCGGNSTMIKLVCLDAEGPFKYGIYQWALSVISSNSLAVKILYLIFWGLMTLR